MPEDTTIYREKLTDIAEVPAPDDLVQGVAVPSEIKLSVAGSYKRGELLMSSGENEFTTATSAGLAGAAEICILCRDCEVPAGTTMYTAGYFTGTFSAGSVVLSWETEANSHAALIDEIRASLRRKAIFLN